MLEGDKPPPLYVVIDGSEYETKLGSYCWSGNGNGVCSDVLGVQDLLEDEPPISVRPNETIQFKLNYEIKPSEVRLAQVEQDNKGIEVPITNNKIKAPADKGVYYHAYSCRWKDEKDETISSGDAYYAFAIVVE
ncbi:hypothetical protein CEQ21_26725 [Niallia circulans]|uniref:Uncharacterized protein n=1 Tax=Niallia circulans TaxID=1397 RepID=A0A553SPR0_NIACI|nr:hypothetical protein [Niallia circulans]TRZ38957.1 hypothetical protein CEQ21_26725 [Niallia circulans]